MVDKAASEAWYDQEKTAAQSEYWNGGVDCGEEADEEDIGQLDIHHLTGPLLISAFSSAIGVAIALLKRTEQEGEQLARTLSHTHSLPHPHDSKEKASSAPPVQMSDLSLICEDIMSRSEHLSRYEGMQHLPPLRDAVAAASGGIDRAQL